MAKGFCGCASNRPPCLNVLHSEENAETGKSIYACEAADNMFYVTKSKMFESVSVSQANLGFDAH